MSLVSRKYHSDQMRLLIFHYITLYRKNSKASRDKLRALFATARGRLASLSSSFDRLCSTRAFFRAYGGAIVRDGAATALVNSHRRAKYGIWAGKMRQLLRERCRVLAARTCLLSRRQQIVAD